MTVSGPPPVAMDNLVNYSDSDSDPESTSSASPCAKRSRLSSESSSSNGSAERRSKTTTATLPSASKLDVLLTRKGPNANAALKLTKIRPAPAADSPDAHDGRMRSFPHEEGNWATHVYVPRKSPRFVVQYLIMWEKKSRSSV